MRELVWMANGRREMLDRLEWDHTSAICACIVNFSPFNQKQTTPAALNPYNKKQDARPLMIPLRKLMEMVDLGGGNKK